MQIHLAHTISFLSIADESGMLEDAMCGPDDSMFKMTVSPKDAPEQSEILQIEFSQGIPTKVTNMSDGTVKTNP